MFGESSSTIIPTRTTVEMKCGAYSTVLNQLCIALAFQLIDAKGHNNRKRKNESSIERKVSVLDIIAEILSGDEFFEMAQPNPVTSQIPFAPLKFWKAINTPYIDRNEKLQDKLLQGV